MSASEIAFGRRDRWHLTGVALFAVLVIVGWALSPSASAQPSASVISSSAIPGKYIVVFKDSVEHTRALAETQTEQRDGELGFVYSGAPKGYSVADLSQADVEALREDSKVKAVVPDRLGKLAAQTTPTGLQRIYATSVEALDIDEVDDVRVDVDVAIIDTGVDPVHPDLNVAGRTDCASGVTEGCVDGQGIDENGHGTHVGGIAGALDNGFGAVGVAPGARLWGVRVSVGNSVPLSTTIAGIKWVTAHAATIEVANISIIFGIGGTEVEIMEEAIEDAVEAGVVFVAAAGNEDLDTVIRTPASFDDVIAVSALSDYDGLPGGLKAQNCEFSVNRGADDTLGRYSNWGEVVDIAAPGTCIYSTLPSTGSPFGSNYGKFSGTSQASPHVAGAAAILASESNPDSREDVEALRQKLLGEGSLEWEDNSGDGDWEPLLDLRAPTSMAITAPASDLQTNSAQLNGALSAGGLATSYRFEYGTSTEYGTSVPASPKSIGSGVNDIEVSEQVSVVPDTTYHYRIVVTNSSGSFYGKDRTFTTSNWTVQDGSDPSESSGLEMDGGSCASGSECVAVGSYFDKVAKKFVTLAERWDGTSWSLQTTPNPEGAIESKLTKVSCVSSTFCIAAGRYKTASGYPKPLAMRWNGTEWSLLSVPMPTPTGEGVAANGILRGISCTSTSSCVAVGHYVNSNFSKFDPFPGEEKTLIEIWDGTKWTIQTSPNSASKKFNILTGVSCSSATACTAVGTAGPGGLLNDHAPAFGSEILAERWDGTSWSVQSTPSVPESSRPILEAVSCPSAAVCMAVGNARTNQGEFPGFTMRWSNGEWQLISNALVAPLYDVSCTATDSCDAVGDSDSILQGRYWNGLQWSPEDLATPEGGVEARIRAVSCPSKGLCTAMGSYRTRSGRGSRVPLPERLNVTRVHKHPSAKTGSASAIHETKATLNGEVTTAGLDTTYRFEWGTTTSYGNSVPVPDEGVGSGGGAIKVAKKATGLNSNTLYHFRLVATNSEGTVYGEDRTFKTLNSAEAPSGSAFLNVNSGITAVKGSLSGANHVLQLGLGGDKFTCSKVAFSSELEGLQSPQMIASPELGGCSWVSGLTFSWAMNGCELRLRPGPGNAATETTVGWIDIVSCQSPMSVSSAPCTITIGNQNGVGKVEYKGIGTGEGQTVQMIANLSGIEYTRTGCGSNGTFTNGTYTGEWNLKGSVVGNEAVQKPLGMEAKPPSNFKAEEAPVTIVGEGVENKPIFEVPGNGSVKCSGHALSGNSATVTATSITVSGPYSGCTFLGASATLSMGGCSYVLHAAGGLDIVGANCATNKITVSGGGCTATIGPQSSASSALTYANAGSGKSRSVSTGGEAKKLQVAATGGGCISTGAFSTGVFKSLDRFTAKNSLGQPQGIWVE